MSAYRDFIGKLEAHGCRPRPGAGGYVAHCPAHEDRNASLKVDDGGDRVLVYCHTGCSFESITNALKLEPGEAFDEENRPPPPPKPPEFICEWDGRDHDDWYHYYSRQGEHAIKQRIEDRYQGAKSFMWIHESKGKLYRGLPRTLDGHKKPESCLYPYGIGGTDADVRHGGPNDKTGVGLIILVESEKTVDFLNTIIPDEKRMFGGKILVVTHPGGATAWRNVYAYDIANKAPRTVYIHPDNDEPGLEFAQRAAHSIVTANEDHPSRPIGRIAIAPPTGVPGSGYDLADHPNLRLVELENLWRLAEDVYTNE